MDELTSAIPAHLMGAKPEEAKAKNNLGKDDFMKLLMVQLQNQDPLNPMDHKEMSAQLAQFGSLEQLTNISGGIEKMQSGMGGEAKLQAVSMIGKTVQASGKEATLVAGEPLSLNLDSTEQGRPTKVSIFDTEGKLVREMPVAGRSDKNSVVWDGKTGDGVQVPEGKYTFRVSAVGTDGKAKEMDPSVQGEVVGVELEGTAPILVVKTASGKARINIDKIRNVGSSQEKAKPAMPPTGQMGELPAMMRQSIPVRQAEGGAEQSDSARNQTPAGESAEGGAMAPWHSEPFILTDVGGRR